MERITGFLLLLTLSCPLQSTEMTMKSIREFGVLPNHDPVTNKTNLQKAIDWASRCGAALWVEPDEQGYPMAGGLVLRQNAGLIGVHGPVGRGTRHPQQQRP
ncbi:hypothetical protein GX408_18600, partial [bacterium]|nr:hypothetical protein [bacterium]